MKQQHYDHRKIRKQLGQKTNGMDTQVLTALRPDPDVIEDSFFDALTQKLFDADECNQIVMDNAPDAWSDPSLAIEEDERPEWLSNKNVWLEPANNIWLFDKLLAIVLAANERYKFEVDFFDAVQLVKYEEGDFYDWHFDCGPGRMGNRKLSATVQLSASDTYEGGNLVLDIDDYNASRELGSVTVFPSFLKHKVTPVTQGTRYALVVWCSGNQRFR